MIVSVIDIGSNSIKWVVAERTSKFLKVLREESHSTRLAGDLIHTGRLGEEAIENTLKVFAKICQESLNYRVERATAVATSAVRDSENRKDFLKRAKKVLGYPVQILSGNEEAEIIFQGTSADPYWNSKDLFVIDIGGGSAEWIQGLKGKIEKRISLPLGCVRIRERFIQDYPVGMKKIDEMCLQLEEQLRPVLATYRLQDRILVGTGGTATCLSAIQQKLKDFDPEKVDHFNLTHKHLMSLLRRFSKKKLSSMLKIVGLPKKRADLIIPGMCVLKVTMDLLGATELRTSTRGLRYGVIERLVSKPASKQKSIF
jgi:exopolyphosphatase/guanosine-5'-triphosphate,3'-diphosphate pyrophosphatase